MAFNSSRVGTRFLNGFLSGTLCSAFALYLYNRNSRRIGQDKFVLPRIQAGGKPRLQELDPKTSQQLRGLEILKYGIPDRGQNSLLYNNHVLCYDQAKKIPVWVAEHIIKSDLEGPADKGNSQFQSDPQLSKLFSATYKDYSSPWTKGHMSPAADHKFSQQAMDDTFYLSNIIPQDGDNNKNFWNRFEIYCRDLTEKFAEVRVISGPLMIPTKQGSKEFVKYEVIGSNKVAVPTHLFKIIYAENPQKPNTPVAVGAFKVPNKPINSDQLKQFQVPLNDLEKLAGVHFLPKLPENKQVDLCRVDRCLLISQEQLEEQYNSQRKNWKYHGKNRREGTY